MAGAHGKKGFVSAVWRETGPIISHAAVVLLLEVSLLLIGLLTLGLERVFPKQEYYFSIIERIDIWISLALLCLFGAYTLIIVSIRLIKAVLREAREPDLPVKEESSE